MKWHAYNLGNGYLTLVNHILAPHAHSGDYLGEVDLPIIAPKKTVVKEAFCFNEWAELGKRGKSYHIPENARNVKCTYEIEE